MENDYTSAEDLAKVVLERYPYPVAVAFRRVLNAADWAGRIDNALRLFEYGIRTIALGLVSQYLIRDANQVSDPGLNRLLHAKFPRATLGTWNEILFTTLKAYGNKRDLFFMKELYDLYWDSSTTPHRARHGIRQPYDRLIQIRNDFAHRFKPTSEAEWQATGQEVMESLQAVLRQFLFLQNYEMVRVIEGRGHSYVLMEYTGEHPRRLNGLFESEEDLELGSFYLRQGQRALPLHPLLILWSESGIPEIGAELKTDAALYESFTKTSVTYLATVIQKEVNADLFAGEFARMLYYTIEKVKQYRREAQRLSWDVLRDAATQVNDARFGNVRAKYNKDLYLQRETVKQQFDEFLVSGKTAFLLLGKSGVGKSNFLASLAEEYGKSGNYCFLFYDGAKLESDRSLSEIFAGDLENYIRLVGARGEIELKDAIYQISQIADIDQRRVVVVIDAVNENANAKALLRRIDELIESYFFSWFKVIFSSRPEAWRQVKRGVKLAENRYYWVTDRDEMGVELQTFALGVEVESFTRNELPTVYEKYKHIYKLQTEYSDLSPELRQLLKDPLTLRLVAETNRGQSIPKQILPGEIYQQYVTQLVRDERLQLEDVVFLEEDLMPLMIDEGQLENVITAQQVNSTLLRDGRRLLELVYNDEVLSTGRRINQRFTNLVDTEILVQRGDPIDYELGFKYERFYEYYAGKRLFRLATTSSDPKKYFLDLINRIEKRPYLWGAIKNALVLLGKQKGTDLLEQMCYTEDQRTKELLVSVLTDLGRDKPEAVHALTRKIFPETRAPSEFQKLRRFVRQTEQEQDRLTRNVRKMAIEVSGALADRTVLITAGCNSSPEIRSSAVRETYYLWNRNSIAGFGVLNDLKEHCLQGILPDLYSFESLLGISFIIFSENYQDSNVLLNLQRIWRDVIRKFVAVQDTSEGIRGQIRTIIRGRIFSIIISFAFKVFGQYAFQRFLQYREFRNFFQLDQSAKDLYGRLVKYIDVGSNYTLVGMKRDYLSALEVNNLMIYGVTLFGFVAHSSQSPLQFLEFMKQFFEEAKRHRSINPYWLNVVAQALIGILDFHPELDDVFTFFMEVVDVIHKNPLNGEKGSLSAYLGPYMYFQYRREGSIQTEWFVSRIENALRRQDVDFFSLLLGAELPLVGIENQRPQIALAALDTFMAQRPQVIEEAVQGFLARMRLYYPDEIDDYMESHRVGKEFELKVRTNEPTETIGQLVGMGLWTFFRDEAIVNSPVLRGHLMRVLGTASDAPSADVWLGFLLREIANLVYGEDILQQPSLARAA